MKYAIIDVGSNSVRLLLKTEKKHYKKIKNTRLAEGFKDGCLNMASIERTVNAVVDFVFEAIKKSVDEIYAYGTAILRKATNADVFLEKVKSVCGVSVEIISGDLEAELGALGALSEQDGGVIDVGGASTEIIVFSNKSLIYEKSADVGAVVLKDACGQNMSDAQRFVSDKIQIYGKIPKTNFYAIGGTATSIASVLLQLKKYNPQKVDKYKISIDDVKNLTYHFYDLSIEERLNIKGLQKERAEIISCGTLIFLMIMEKYNIKEITVSESDNLEGCFNKRFNNEKKI